MTLSPYAGLRTTRMDVRRYNRATSHRNVRNKVVSFSGETKQAGWAAESGAANPEMPLLGDFAAITRAGDVFQQQQAV